jgi:pimeloyl-ACP methyl ester carboxylesterase
VLEELKKRFDQQYFVLWGRSMGAVAGLLYLSKLRECENSGIVVAIFDSPFYSLQQLAL